MIAYIDTPIFIDYFVGRHEAGTVLRATPRRHRSPEQLGTDAARCFQKLALSHSIVTSALTFYEAEEAMLNALHHAREGRPRSDKLLVPAARAVVEQMFATVTLFDIRVLELTDAIVTAQYRNLEFVHRGIRSADALHISTALLHNANVLITGDKKLVALDSLLQTNTAGPLRCFDTDTALTFIG